MVSQVMNIPLAQRRRTLQPQEQLPVLTCAGWLNGTPEGPSEAGHSLVVLDVWAQWCTEVPKAVAGLKQLHKEFSPLGVRFVSVTMDNQQTVDAFVRANETPWPSGYGATVETINAFGAANYDMPTPGYEVKPVIYLATADGRVVWSDDHQRMDHSEEDKASLLAGLRKELEARLAASAGSPAG